MADEHTDTDTQKGVRDSGSAKARPSVKGVRDSGSAKARPGVKGNVR